MNIFSESYITQKKNNAILFNNRKKLLFKLIFALYFIFFKKKMVDILIFNINNQYYSCGKISEKHHFH